jgi:site-specific DNA-methyltransferase (adenine-specific)
MITQQLYQNDFLLGGRSITNNSISLIVTSPPYKDKDGFSYTWMDSVWREMFRLLKPDGLVFLNFGHLADDKFRPFKVCEQALNIGFKLNDTITWVKNHYKPIQGNKRLNNLSEFIFILYKEKMRQLNRLAVGVPYKDKSNVKRFAKGVDLKCGGNVWHIPYETIQKKEDKLHNDRFPLELPLRCIKLANLNSEEIILDPFSGSGTSACAAVLCNNNFIGFEKKEENYNKALKRLLTFRKNII